MDFKSFVFGGIAATLGIIAMAGVSLCIGNCCDKSACCNQEPSEHTQRWLEIMDRRLEKLERVVFKTGAAESE